MDIPSIIANLITEDPNIVKDAYAAVAVVNHGNTWLLGLSKADDDRKGTWCFPGGGIKNNENPQKTAERECSEETGISCKSQGRTTTLKEKPGVVFVRCRATSTRLKPNHEFIALGWYTRRDLRSLKLYNNVLTLLDKLS